jgi:hypothetical protein
MGVLFPKPLPSSDFREIDERRLLWSTFYLLKLSALEVIESDCRIHGNTRSYGLLEDRSCLTGC